MTSNRETWLSQADICMNAMERQAALAWGQGRDAGSPVYTVAGDSVRAILRRDSQSGCVGIVWTGLSRDYCRAEIQAAIADRMAERLG